MNEEKKLITLSIKDRFPSDLLWTLKSEAAQRKMDLYQYIIHILINRPLVNKE